MYIYRYLCVRNNMLSMSLYLLYEPIFACTLAQIGVSPPPPPPSPLTHSLSSSFLFFPFERFSGIHTWNEIAFDMPLIHAFLFIPRVFDCTTNICHHTSSPPCENAHVLHCTMEQCRARILPGDAARSTRSRVRFDVSSSRNLRDLPSPPLPSLASRSLCAIV